MGELYIIAVILFVVTAAVLDKRIRTDHETEWYRRKNSFADYLVCFFGIAMYGIRAFHGIAFDTFVLGRRNYPPELHYEMTGVLLSLVDILFICIFVAWLLRGNRWRNLACAILGLSYLIFAMVVLIIKS